MRLRRLRRLFELILGLCPLALAQTSSPLPAGIAVYGTYNQLSTASSNWGFGMSGAYTTKAQQSIAMFNVTAVDFEPVKGTDPTTGKQFVGFTAALRQELHEAFLRTGKFTASFGVGAGPALSSAPASVTFSATASFDVTAMYRLNSYLSLILPLRMEYISNIGNGQGAFNPIAQFGILLNTRKLPPPATTRQPPPAAN